ncbi:MAG: bifunctional ornithine acetyltransferase/N-acetylglutamate synthase [Actinobacteria bacterium]|nr:bifunctional ornithine acetyltransferase/N-acetylglutamate synthase [Actinomycetota bacterium]
MSSGPSISDLDGVYANAIQAGIKEGGYDLSYIYVPDALASAGVFTKNQCPASSVIHTRKALKRGVFKVIVVSSGNANAGTGEKGASDTQQIVKSVAKKLGLKQSEVAVAATGIIGKRLPLDKVQLGIEALFKDAYQKHGEQVAEGILTTDTFTKTAYTSQKVGKKTVQVAGIAKGSGMIAPNMATMLGFLVTDAKVSSAFLQRALTEAVGKTFNRISVDTDTSTSDMVLVLSTGKVAIAENDPAQAQAFKSTLTEATHQLAQQIIRDGEGAKTVIEATVKGAITHTGAEEIARHIIDSPLVKTAIHGQDPNWGRILMAIGKSQGTKINQKKLMINIQNNRVYQEGAPTDFDLEQLRQSLDTDTVSIEVDCQLGTGTATCWGCELTKGYIDINTAYN